jgi:hypothetical protein
MAAFRIAATEPRGVSRAPSQRQIEIGAALGCWLGPLRPQPAAGADARVENVTQAGSERSGTASRSIIGASARGAPCARGHQLRAVWSHGIVNRKVVSVPPQNGVVMPGSLNVANPHPRRQRHRAMGARMAVKRGSGGVGDPTRLGATQIAGFSWGQNWGQNVIKRRT